MVQLTDIVTFCNETLQAAEFDDYCPNGLQVDAGRQEVQRMVSAVTASQAAIEAAIEKQADVLLVHHGYFWKGEAQPLTGMKGQRIRLLMQHGISLLAYHLPLDAHAELGNNAQLAKRLRIEAASPLTAKSLIWQAQLRQPETACGLSQLLSGALGRDPLHIAGGPIQFTRIGWCTGAAQSYLEQAAAAGLQAFISGEISENTVHMARELGIHYFSAGHHATERYGVQALGALLAEKFALTHEFVEISNPV
jgi:dinuclear metal center YbgI/SA1388 family protein